MATHYVKANDTRPIIEVVLRNPDGSVHDLTGSTAWTLHVQTPNAVVSRDLVLEGDPGLGTLRYTGTAADWDPDNPDGYFPQPSPTYPLSEYPMEYEVSGGSSVLTFPNDSHDYLRITKDLG